MTSSSSLIVYLTDPEGADLDNYSLHAIAATVTSFFRELPEPLLTKDLYTDFIRATGTTLHNNYYSTQAHNEYLMK